MAIRSGSALHNRQPSCNAMPRQQLSRLAAAGQPYSRLSSTAALSSQSAVLRGTALCMWPLGMQQHRPHLGIIAAAGSSERPIKPYYNKFRSRADIERSYLRQWQEVTARGAEGSRRMTVFSALAYLPQWAKYTLVPDFVRFLWWLVWVRICAVAHFFHRRAVKQGAKLDAFLEGRRSGRKTFSRAMVLRRFHHRVGLWENARYRWRLMQGGAAEGGANAAVQPQAT